MIIIIGLCIILASTAFIPFKQALVFYKENTDELEIYLPLQTGDAFQLIWKHSIHETDVVEKYEVLDNRDIQQYEMVYEHYGIGMPSYAVGDEEYVYEDGKHHIKNMSNVFPEIKLRNGKAVSKNRIAWGDSSENREESEASYPQHIVPLNNFVDPGDWFTLKIESLSLWDLIKGEEIRE